MTATVPPLTPAYKAVFGLGSGAEAIVYSSIASFGLLFYNQVLGLDAAAVGAVMAVGVLVNAVFEPIIGSWSDRTRSRFGRRHPFMFASTIPIALAFFAFFSPPSVLDDTGKLIWLGITNLVLAQAVTAYHTPHLAFGGELSSNYTERSRVMGYNTFFLWAGDTACWLLSFAWFFRATPGFPNGALDPARWPVFASSASILVLACLAVSSIFTLSRVRYVAQPPPDLPGFTIAEIGRDIVRALRNRNYRLLLGAYIFLSLTSGIRAGLWIYTATFFWQLRNDQISFFVIGSFISYLTAAALVAQLHGRFGKRGTGAVAMLIYSAGPGIPLALGYFGLLTSATPGLLVILIAFGLLQHLPFSIITTTIFSTISDIADENELLFGIRQEGVLYSTSTFFIKLDQALGAALAGAILTWTAFPAKAVPGLVDPAILKQLALAYVLCGIPGFIAAGFYARLGISAATHAQTRAALHIRIDAPNGETPGVGIPFVTK